MMKSSNRAFQNTLPKVEIHHQDKITITNPSCFQGEEILEKKKTPTWSDLQRANFLRSIFSLNKASPGKTSRRPEQITDP